MTERSVYSPWNPATHDLDGNVLAILQLHHLFQRSKSEGGFIKGEQKGCKSTDIEPKLHPNSHPLLSDIGQLNFFVIHVSLLRCFIVYKLKHLV